MLCKSVEMNESGGFNFLSVKYSDELSAIMT